MQEPVHVHQHHTIGCRQSGPDSRELRAFLQRSLPDHLIPAAFVIVESIPRLPNGKVDRAALPVPNIFTQPVLRLPFKSGQVWTVIQGYPSGGSHSGGSAFSLDLVLGLPQMAGQQSSGKSLPSSPYPYANDPSCGEPVLASAAGQIVEARDDGGAPEDSTDPQNDSINNDYDGWDVCA